MELPVEMLQEIAVFCESETRLRLRSSCRSTLKKLAPDPVTRFSSAFICCYDVRSRAWKRKNVPDGRRVDTSIRVQRSYQRYVIVQREWDDDTSRVFQVHINWYSSTWFELGVEKIVYFKHEGLLKSVNALSAEIHDDGGIINYHSRIV